MKHKVLTVFLLIFITLFYGCKEDKKKPAIFIAEATYDFGIIEEGKSVSHVFEFTNTGTGTLLVNAVRPACGCTVAGEYDKEVKPGQTGKISLSFDSTGFESFISKPIVVNTNIPDNSDIILAIQGVVKVAVNLSPKTLNFEDIKRDRTTPLQGVISIFNRLAEPMQITDIIYVKETGKKPNVTFAGDNVETMINTINDGFEYNLVVTVKPPFKYGQVMGSIIVKTDREQSSEIKTGFSYHMRPLVTVFPNPLFVNQEQITRGKEQQLNIECEPGFDLRIVDFSVNNTEVKLNLKEVEQGRKYRLGLQFPKGFKFNPGSTLTVTFKTQNVPDEPIFSIPVLKM